MEIFPDKKQFQQLKLILKTVCRSNRSNFYRTKYRRVGFRVSRDLRTSEAVNNIPFLAREELTRTPPDKRLYVPKSEISGFKYTSGTSGGINIMYRSRRDFMIKHENRHPPHTIVMYLRRVESVPKLSEIAFTKGELPIFSDYNNLDTAAKIAASTKIEALVANPVKSIEFGERLRALYNMSRIKRVRLSTKRTTAMQKKMLKKLYPRARFYSFYSMVESDGFIGRQCPRLSKNDLNLYHLHSRFFGELNRVEGCRENEGELVITHLKMAPTPLIRYRTGDLVEWIGKSPLCPCSTPIFRFLGRANFDAVRLTANNLTLRAEDIENALKNFYKYILDFQAHIFERELKGKVCPYIVLELLVTENLATSITKKIENSFRDGFRFWYSYIRHGQEKTVGGVLKQKLLSGFKIKFVDKFSGPEKRFIVDHR